MSHALLSPSSAPIWGHCSGSVMAQMGIPSPDTAQTREGTAAHWVMAEVLFAYRGGVSLSADDFIGRVAPNGVVIDETMAEGAQVMIDDVVAMCDRHNCAADLLVEQRVDMPQIHPTHNWGTLDAAVYLKPLRTIVIWDYKHGHRDCDPKENLQLIDYIAGLVTRFNIDGYESQFITVSLRIVQPFCYYVRGPVREWVVKLADLRAYWNVLQMQAHEAFTDPKLTTGVWCRDCRALGKCPATRKARYNFIELANQPYEMDDMTSHDLAVERLILKDGLAVTKARLEAIEDELRHRITAGDTGSGYTVEAVPGREHWAVPPNQVKAVFGQFEVDVTKDDILTPTQALKKTPKDKRPLIETFIKQFTKRESALTLVPVEESRNARAFKPKTEQ